MTDELLRRSVTSLRHSKPLTQFGRRTVGGQRYGMLRRGDLTEQVEFARRLVFLVQQITHTWNRESAQNIFIFGLL